MQKNITQTWIVVGSILLSVIITYADNHPESTEKKNLEGSVSAELEDGRISSVNSRRITINLGREDGVKRGMTLEIYRSKTMFRT